MSKVDRLRRRLIKKHPAIQPNYIRAVSAYFDMVKYVHNKDGGFDPDADIPEIDTPGFWELFNLLDLNCTQEEMRAWIGSPEEGVTE